MFFYKSKTERNADFFFLIAGLSKGENDYLHEKWCNDIASKLLCVFVLDRFGDYVSDQVIFSALYLLGFSHIIIFR